jgi:hypothetical protein
MLKNSQCNGNNIGNDICFYYNNMRKNNIQLRKNIIKYMSILDAYICMLEQIAKTNGSYNKCDDLIVIPNELFMLIKSLLNCNDCDDDVGDDDDCDYVNNDSCNGSLNSNGCMKNNAINKSIHVCCDDIHSCDCECKNNYGMVLLIVAITKICFDTCECKKNNTNNTNNTNNNCYSYVFKMIDLTSIGEYCHPAGGMVKLKCDDIFPDYNDIDLTINKYVGFKRFFENVLEVIECDNFSK